MKYKELRGKTTKKETARLLGIEERTYANYENEITEPKIETLIEIANFYNVSLDYLCDRPFNNGIGFIPEERKETIKDLLSLTENEFKEVSAFIKGFKIGKNQDEDFQIFNRRKEND